MAGMVKGPAIFLAQFAGDAAPFNSFDGMCGWAASLGYKGVQIPAWDETPVRSRQGRLVETYCDEIAGNREEPWPRGHRARDPSVRASSSP